MDEQQVKDYLKNNLKLDFEIMNDIYQINPDQITIYLKLEDEVIDQIVMYDLNSY
jgi:hypothetical protein